MTIKTSTKTWSWLLAALLVGACGAPDEATLLATARSQLDKGDRAAAVISAKNALQANANSAPARVLLGQALLESGDPLSAALELAKARDLKAPDVQVQPLLARALLTQGLAKKVVDDFAAMALDDRTAQAELSGTVAAAYLAMGQVQNAQQALKASLEAAPASPDTLLVQARLTAAGGDIDGAMAQLQQVAQRKPGDARPLSILGELQFRQGAVEPALASFRQAIQVDPGLAAAHTGIISILLERKDEAGARKQFEAMQAARPNHPETQFFLAQFAYMAGDMKQAREVLAKLLRYTPDNVRVLQLKALVDLRLNDLQQAEAALNKVLQLQPDQASARRLLALVNLRMGKEDKGLSLLAPLLEAQTVDTEAMSMAANVHLGRGDAAAAEALYARAAKASPQDPAVRIALALSRLARGDLQGFDALQAVADEQADPAADLALISARLRRGELDAAQKAIAGLRRKQPDSPLADQLTGRVAVLRGDAAAGRLAFDAALKLDPVYFPAVASLVALDLGKGDGAAAQARMEALVKASPNDMRARLALVELKSRQGASRAETIAALAEIVAALPNEPTLRVQLVEQHLAGHDFKNALLAARDAATALPNDHAVLDVLGRAQLANGEGQQAVISFKRMALLQPSAALPHLRLANAYRVQGNSQQANDSLRQALNVAPGDASSVREVVEALLQARQFDTALAGARALQQARPGSSHGLLLEGDVEAYRNNWPAALAAYRAAVAKSKPGDKAAGALHRALLRAKQSAEADAFMAARIRSHPGDVDFMLYRSDLLMLRGDRQGAEAGYAQVLARQPDNLAALNNMAWLQAMRGQVDAVGYAQRAVGLQPDNPALLDTLALSLGASGQHARAIEIAKRAMSLAPEAPAFRLTLARLYIDAGDKPKARQELQQLASLGAKFDGQAAVARLLKSLDA